MTSCYDQVEPQRQPSTSREVRYAHAKNLAEVLGRAGISIVLSTYQAGKLVVIGTRDGRLELGFCNYDRPMGIAIDQQLNRLAVATRDVIWIANNETSVARQLPGPGVVGSCFLTRSAHVTGDIQAHEIAWADRELWIVNTRFSCLCTLDEEHSFVPRWRPRFIDRLVAEDRCHLNGLAVEHQRPKYVTVLAETNTADGWRPVKNRAGCLIDITSNEVVVGNLVMPHSPVVDQGSVYLLNSGLGALVRVGPSGDLEEIGRFPGYARGLAIYDQLAVVGLSKIRETSTFGGIPISERAHELKCGIAIVNLSTGNLVSQFEFQSGVDEVFDVTVIPHPGRVVLRGPYATQDGHDTIWLLPPA